MNPWIWFEDSILKDDAAFRAFMALTFAAMMLAAAMG